MKKICLLIHSLQPGGTERVMSELATYFSTKKKVEVHLILYGKSRSIFYDIPKKVTVHTPDFEFDNNKRMMSSLKTLSFIRKKVKSLEPEVILNLGEYWNGFVMLSLIGLDFSVYLSDRCKPDKNLGFLHENLRSFLYPKATGIIAQTEYARTVFIEKNLNENVKVIGNPVKPIKNINEKNQRENIILTVGRLIDTKHHDRLIQIFNSVKRDDWKLIIVGGDALKQDGMKRLKKLIDMLNLQNRVLLTGNVRNVDEYYLKSKIFAFTSSSEGFPNVIGEAMSAGLPIISYDCIAGPSELVRDGENGYLIPLFKDNLFVEKLNELMDSPELCKKMGEVSMNQAQAYSGDSIAEAYFEFIAS